MFPRRKLAEDARRRLGLQHRGGAQAALRSSCPPGQRSPPGRLSGSPATCWPGTTSRQNSPSTAGIPLRNGGRTQMSRCRDVAMSRTEAERQAEHQQLLDDETAESRAAGIPQWEVRVDPPPITKRLCWRASFAEKGERLYGAGNSLSSGQQRGRCSGTRRPDQAGGTSRRYGSCRTLCGLPAVHRFLIA